MICSIISVGFIQATEQKNAIATKFMARAMIFLDK